MSQPLDTPPYRSDVTEKPGLLSGDWTRWLQLFWARLSSAVQFVGKTVALTDQSAAIAATTLQTVTQGGLYRVSWYARVTVADGVSSSVQLTLTWREGSHTSTKTFTALTGDTTSTYDGLVWPFYADSGTVVQYSVAYASNTPLKMRYRLAMATELVN